MADVTPVIGDPAQRAYTTQNLLRKQTGAPRAAHAVGLVILEVIWPRVGKTAVGQSESTDRDSRQSQTDSKAEQQEEG